MEQNGGMRIANTAQSHEEYIAAVEEPKRQELQQLHDLVRTLLPKFEPVIISGIMGYGQFHYKGKSKACEGEWFRVGLSANKTGISIYICAGDENGYFPEQARDRLGKATVGRSCIRFKKLSDINLDVVEEILNKTRDAESMF
jgi:hypothetical protein